jgi:hypothetical protein
MPAPSLLTYYRNNLNDQPITGQGGGGTLPFFPILTFNDNFTRSNGDLGKDWLTQSRYNNDTNSIQAIGATINANKALFNGPLYSQNPNIKGMSTLWIPRRVIATDPNTGLPGGIWTKNQYAKFTFYSISATSGVRFGLAIFAKGDEGGSVNEYQAYNLIIEYSGGSFSSVNLRKDIGGGYETGSTDNILATSSTQPVQGDVLELDGIYNSSTSVTLTYKKNGAVIFTYTDTSALPQQGYPTISWYTQLGTTSINLTYFECGVL